MTDLEERLGHAFAAPALLKRALTHASADAIKSNERLEFLGDRVLGLIIAEDIHDRFPHDAEGALALKYNALVRREACGQVAEMAGLAEHLIMAQSEGTSGGRRKTAILAGVCEAVIAALYLDGGIEAARRFVHRYWKDGLETLGSDMRDAKTALQEWAQARKASALYTVISREGPDHAPRFVVSVSAGGFGSGTGEGGSKREAEQNAAAALLATLTGS